MVCSRKGAQRKGFVCSVPRHMYGTQGVEEERREHGSEILRNEFEMKLICNSKLFIFTLAAIHCMNKVHSSQIQ